MEFVADLYKKEGYRLRITMSTPALIYGLSRNSKWKCDSLSRKSANAGALKGSGSSNRITASFEYIKN